MRLKEVFSGDNTNNNPTNTITSAVGGCPPAANDGLIKPKEKTLLSRGSLTGDIVEIKRETIPTSEESIDTETVDRIKTLAQSLNDKKTDIDSRIQNVLAKVGFSAGIDDNLKIEIDTKGKILVSGIKDRKLAKQIQQELNKDKSLARDIKDFRMERSNFSHALKETTGFGLDDLAIRKAYLEDPENMTAALWSANREIESLRSSEKENIKALGNSMSLFTSEDLFDFQDIPLFAGDDELLEMVGSLSESTEVDFARENPGVVDPLSTIERIGRQVLFEISEAFDRYNCSVRKMWEGDEEEIQKRLLHLGDFKMNIDENGMAGVEGTFSKSIQSNNDAQDMIEQMLKETLEAPGIVRPPGVDSPLKTAMSRFLELHEDNFGDTDEFHHALGFDIKGGMAISAYAYSPEAEAASTAVIGEAVTQYINASGIPNADQLEIEIDDEGRIVLATPIADEALANRVERLLDDLNSGLAKATSKESEANFESDGSALGNAIAEIAPHLRHVMSHRPGGGYLSVAIPDEDATAKETKVEEQKELFDENRLIRMGINPGTRSYAKPGFVRAWERLA